MQTTILGNLNTKAALLPNEEKPNPQDASKGNTRPCVFQDLQKPSDLHDDIPPPAAAQRTHRAQGTSCQIAAIKSFYMPTYSVVH